MKKHLRTAAGWTTLAGLTLLAAGCSDAGGAEPTEDGTTPAVADGGSLTVWVMGDSSANFEQLVAPFAADTGTEVEVVAIPWDAIDERITTAVGSGDGPDLLQIGLSKLRTFADAGVLMDLSDATGDHPAIDPSNFPSGAASAVGEELVSVPWVSDTRVLFTRDDILSEAGIDAPPSTWEELLDAASTLAARGGDQYGYYIPQWDSPLPLEMTWSYGGDVVTDGAIDFDTPEFHAAVDTYLQLYSDGSVPVNGDFDQTQGFVSGIAPMLISGPYLASSISSAAPELDGSWSVSLIPGGDGHDPVSLFAGSNLGVWGSTDNPDGALALLEYLSEPATQLEWYSIQGELPAASAALSDASLAADPMVAVYTEQLASSNAVPLVPDWDGDTGAALLEALNSIALQGADRDSTLQALFDATTGTPTS
ncbi:extracellular solute-binding protein [Demequina sp. NBRC 110052]|uniref:extracellular solute-binding protein n=1 Tax=Demequina sp. NBRC 110052 TaxID=1570341 RepID=UPI000A01E271|nr:extracellular solute-binding protein [Demequina sp. NBRC 110052]